jgi:anti-anti-sigma factor
MDLTLNTVFNAYVARITGRGRILHGVTARALRRCVNHHFQRGRHVVLDLNAVTQMDAHSLGMIALFVRQARRRKLYVVVLAEDGPAKTLLKLTRLDTYVKWPRRLIGNRPHAMKEGQSSDAEALLHRQVSV